jgi:hypothetical protein
MPRPTPIEVRCPNCDRTVVWSPESQWKPFCSERCKLIDLGAWFEEERAIPGDQPAHQATADDPE